MRISIVIPTFNHLEDCLKPCIESILKYTDMTDVELVISCNGCTDGTLDYLLSLPTWAHVNYVWSDEPLGYPKAVNAGIREAKGEYIVLLNNDTVLIPQPVNLWIDMLMEPMSKVDMTGPVITWDEELSRQYLMFFCVMIKKAFFDIWVGMLDESFGMGYCEDIDYCIRATDKGARMQQVPNAVPEGQKNHEDYNFPIWHRGHGTFADDRHDLIQKNRQVLRDRYLTVNSNYKWRCEQPSDIDKLLPILRELATECEHVTEMGVRTVVATYAFLDAKPKKWVGYDIEYSPNTLMAEKLAKDEGIEATFIKQNVLETTIEPTDLLFLDTLHTYEQLKGELERHADKARKYIAIHDTETFGTNGELQGTRGIKPAIEEFLATHKEWYLKEKWVRCNGLTVLARKPTAPFKYSIVIPTYNHLDDCLKPCLESLIEHTDLHNVETLVVANGCTDGTREYVKSLAKHNINLVWLEEASGYTVSTNIGIKASTGEYIILLNNDTILLPQSKNLWIEKMEAPMSDPYMGATGPLALHDPYAQDRILIFFCSMIKREVFENIGLLDEVFAPGGGEDIDFTMKLKQAGFKWLQVPDNNPLPQTFTNIGDFPIYHQNNKTFGEMSEYTRTIIKKNGLINLKRYVKNIKLKMSDQLGQHGGHLTVHPSSHPALLKMPYDNLEFDTGTIEEIITPQAESEIAPNVLNEWKRVLKQDGRIVFECDGPTFQIVNKTQRGKVYDCFSFFNELDLLEIRLNILNDVVDHFVLVEANVTHSNKDKPYYYEENKERFAKFAHKIIHIKVDNLTREEGWTKAWERESGQRNAFIQGLTNCTDEDIVIVSDLDEIPNPDVIRQYDPSTGYSSLTQRLFNYYLNMEDVSEWNAAKILTYKELKTFPHIENVREYLNDRPMQIIPNAGWHFSYLGGSKAIEAKVNAFLHQEFNQPEFNNQENIQQCMKTGDDIYHRRTEKLKMAKLSSLPEYVQKNKAALIEKGLLRKPLVFDCFPFFNELDTLELRLNELDDVVDFFVISELPVTHKGDPKPLYLRENIERFAKFSDKILSVSGDDYPKDPDPWSRERFQRDLCNIALKRHCTDYDLVMISDLDEIPRASAVTKYVDEGDYTLKAFEQQLYSFYMNLSGGDDKPEPGVWGKILPYSRFRNMSACEVRYTDCSNAIIKNGGWHFNYMGGEKAIIKKLESWAHQEWNQDQWKDPQKIIEAIDNGIDPFNRGRTFKFVPVDNSFPKYLVDNKDMYEKKGLLKIKQAADAVVVTSSKPQVTVEISTKNRYFTTLPMAIQSVINQTVKPNGIVIYDDGEQKDLRSESVYNHIFNLLQEHGISWSVLFGQRIGQVANHQHITETAKTDWIWRLDDDDVAEPDCLEKLLKHVKPDVGAISGLVLTPGSVQPMPRMASNKIEDIFLGLNEQWYRSDKVREVDHFNNTFLYRKEAGKHGYPKNLSPVGHREETIFTYEMKRNGWKLILDPSAVVWHLRDPNGGIRSHQREEWYREDEDKFYAKLNEWGVKPRDTKLIVLNNGVGDHLAFKMAYKAIKEKHPDRRHIIAACYPDVFFDVPDVELMSIAEAMLVAGNLDRSEFCVYHWMDENKWNDKMYKAFERMYS